MNGRERFRATIERRPVDRPAWWLGDPLPETIERLSRFYGLDNHPIQALAAGMAADELAAEFGGRASFCGGLDVQHLMAHGTPADIQRCVSELRRLFPTGLVISPNHEALLPDVPPKNVEALREAISTDLGDLNKGELPR